MNQYELFKGYFYHSSSCWFREDEPPDDGQQDQATHREDGHSQTQPHLRQQGVIRVPGGKLK